MKIKRNLKWQSLFKSKIDFKINNIKSSKGKTTSNIQRKTHTVNRDSFSRNSVDQKKMAGYI